MADQPTMGVPVEYEPPAAPAEDVARFVRDHYGLEGSLTPLPSERDLNFLLATAEGGRVVVKVANPAEDPACLALQHAALDRLATRDPLLELPRVVRARDGADACTMATGTATPCLVRVLTWVPGVPLAAVRPRTSATLETLGELLGRLDNALAGFDHPAAHRVLKWDLASARWIEAHWHRLPPARRSLAQRLFTPYVRDVLPRWHELPTGVIYNDANDHNVLVDDVPDEPRRTVAVIDFGDMVWSAEVGEVAIAVAYAMLGARDPLAAASQVVAGYHRVRPLSEGEISAVFPLACARLVVSVVNSAIQREAFPANEYLVISEAPAWTLIERLDAIAMRLATCRLRAACGLIPCPAGPRVSAWIDRHRTDTVPVLPEETTRRGAVPVDLSIASPLVDDLRLLVDEPRLSERIATALSAAGAGVGVGPYGRARILSCLDRFREEGDEGPEWRTLHLGIDLFAAAGTEVRAPLAGRVHRIIDGTKAGTHGPTLILEHAVSDAGGPFVFYTIYGHVDPRVVDRLAQDQPVAAGDVVAHLGSPGVNGGWPPHLHFQVVADLLDGDVLRLARPADREVWMSLCPAPEVLAGVAADARPESSVADLLSSRHDLLGPNLSVSYRRPLRIVRGWMQHLFDADGRRYLDAVNNVPHVGHCHPRVVRAGRQQMAVLNTNTRYLHGTILEYASRLCATLPDPLGVCFFVNSGSEANELALRLAWTHTGRHGTLVIDGAYHGNTTTLVGLSPYKCEGPGGRGLASDARKLPLPDAYRGVHRGAASDVGPRYASHAAEALKGLERAGFPVGAFLAESLLSCGGQIVLPPGYLAEVYRLVRGAGGVTIADEVQVGFGRVGTRFWGFETQQVVPDIVVMGKPAGNGHPLGVVVTTPAIAASFANGMEFFSTFGGNPVSCAIGLAVLDVIEEDGLQARARDVGGYLLAGLESLVGRHPVAGQARGLGLFAGLELVRDRETRRPDGEAASYVANRLRDLGILVSTDGPDHNVLKIKPPLCFDRSDADQLVEALDRVLGEDAARPDRPRRPARTQAS